MEAEYRKAQASGEHTKVRRMLEQAGQYASDPGSLPSDIRGAVDGRKPVAKPVAPPVAKPAARPGTLPVAPPRVIPTTKQWLDGSWNSSTFGSQKIRSRDVAESEIDRGWLSLPRGRGEILTEQERNAFIDDTEGSHQSLGKHIGRWYDKAPGGFDKAVADAQTAQNVNDGGQRLDRNKWVRYPASAVDAKIPTNIPKSLMPLKVTGYSSAFGGTPEQRPITVPHPRGQKANQNTLEHELTHSAFGQSPRSLAGKPTSDKDLVAMGGGDYNKYLLNPVEVDVRLAEIKRRYANETGRIVDTPQKARAAWDWFHSPNASVKKYKNTSGQTYPTSPGQPATWYDDRPTYRDNEGSYDRLPEETKKEFQLRMMELVQNQQQQQGDKTMPTLPSKISAQLITGKRQTPPVHSFLDQTVFDENELKPPTAQDHAGWSRIISDMERARPYQLSDARVLSGRVQPKHLVQGVAARTGEDTLPERMSGIRSELARMYAQATPAGIEQTDAEYHPYANSVILNNSSPGALIHELGHAIDMSRAPNASKMMRSLRWSFKPTLVNEHHAWTKGQNAYREGFATGDKANDAASQAEYLKNIESLYGRKYPALGTYWGGALGALGGGLAGIAAPVAAALATDEPNFIRLSPLLGAIGAGVGVAGGTLAGGMLGRSYAESRKSKLVAAERARLLAMLNNPRAIAKLNRGQQADLAVAERDGRTKKSANTTWRTLSTVGVLRDLPQP